MKKIYIVFKEFYKKSKLLILLYVILAIASNLFSIINPLVMAKLIDSAVYFESMEVFVRFIFYLVSLNIINVVLMPIYHYIDWKIQIGAKSQLMEKIICRIPFLEHESIKNKTIGQILQLVTDDLNNIQKLVVADFVALFANVVYFITVLTILLRLHFTLSVLMLTVLPLMMFFSKIMVPKIHKAREEFISKDEKIKDITDEVFTGSMLIKLANAYVFINNKINTIVTQYKTKMMEYLKKNIIYNCIFTSSTIDLSHIAIIILGTFLVIKGNITVGVLTLLGAYFSGLWNSTYFFMDFYRDFKVNMISVNRVVKYLEIPTESSDGANLEDFMSMEIRDISYRIDSKSILKNLDLLINQGDQILIVGDNGSGKSTLARLLIGLMPSSEGAILYNNREISYYNKYSLRNKVSYIPAEPYIFSGGLEDNFFGKKVNSKLINYESYNDIEKCGNNLSSGEKKRLQLAHGLLQESDVYILDEPLSFVDDATKQDIIEIIKRDFITKTLIVISHESAPFDFCHIKYTMENGTLRQL